MIPDGRRAPLIRVVLAALLVLPAALPAGGQSLEHCRRVTLVDAGTGAAVRGAEDIAVDRRGRRLFLSAFDRWALEDALAAGAADLPVGGIYAVPLEAVAGAQARLRVRRLSAGLPGDLHPHGIALHDDGVRTRLFAINHAYAREAEGWRRRTRIDLFDLRAGELHPAGRIADRALCRANDLVALSAAKVLVSRDHGACAGVGRWLEDLLGLRRARVLLAALGGDGTASVHTVMADIGFANGLALDPARRSLAVAATREGSVRVHGVDRLLAGDSGPRLAVRLDGGPDNLAWTPDGRILAAVHPALLDAGLALKRWLGARRAGSRVVAIDPVDGSRATLVDDPSGDVLNMATAAVAFDGTLVVSAVLDDAVLLCRLPPR